MPTPQLKTILVDQKKRKLISYRTSIIILMASLMMGSLAYQTYFSIKNNAVLQYSSNVFHTWSRVLIAAILKNNSDTGNRTVAPPPSLTSERWQKQKKSKDTVGNNKIDEVKNHLSENEREENNETQHTWLNSNHFVDYDESQLFKQTDTTDDDPPELQPQNCPEKEDNDEDNQEKKYYHPLLARINKNIYIGKDKFEETVNTAEDTEQQNQFALKNKQPKHLKVKKQSSYLPPLVMGTPKQVINEEKVNEEKANTEKAVDTTTIAKETINPPFDLSQTNKNNSSSKQARKYYHPRLTGEERNIRRLGVNEEDNILQNTDNAAIEINKRNHHKVKRMYNPFFINNAVKIKNKQKNGMKNTSKVFLDQKGPHSLNFIQLYHTLKQLLTKYYHNANCQTEKSGSPPKTLQKNIKNMQSKKQFSNAAPYHPKYLFGKSTYETKQGIDNIPYFLPLTLSEYVQYLVKESQLQHRITKTNSPSVVEKIRRFYCQKNGPCYQINNKSGDKIYYACNQNLYCHEIKRDNKNIVSIQLIAVIG